MRRIARRLDRDTGEIEPGRQRALRRQIVERRDHEAAEIAEDIIRSVGVMPGFYTGA